MTRIAVVDLGSNSTRLLVADVSDRSVATIARASEITRLGEGVDARGRMSDAAMERVFDSVSRYRDTITRLAVDRTTTVATSAVRDSDNGARFLEALRTRFGLEARVLSGDEEARLTFMGATAHRSPSGEATLVIDIGGGSTELVVGPPGRGPSFHVSMQAGSVRQSERHLFDDPPSPRQLARLRADLRRIVTGSVPPHVRARIGTAIAVAGAATSLAAIDQRLDPYDSERVEGYWLSAEACARILDELAALPLAELRRVPGLHPQRAPTIVAGTAILLESIEAFAVPGVVTSEADIMIGAVLEAVAM